jgi:hypothetical protein
VELDTEVPPDPYPDLGRWPAVAGIASVVLLAASVRWAHHFGLVTDLLIMGWATSFLLALATSILSKSRTLASKRSARLGLALSLVSVAVLIVAGVAFAAGGDPAGACGGG